MATGKAASHQCSLSLHRTQEQSSIYKLITSINFVFLLFMSGLIMIELPYCADTHITRRAYFPVHGRSGE